MATWLSANRRLSLLSHTQGKMSFEKYPVQGADSPAKQQTLCIFYAFLNSPEQFRWRSWKASFAFWLYNPIMERLIHAVNPTIESIKS
jgi:hypothetical protein